MAHCGSDLKRSSFRGYGHFILDEQFVADLFTRASQVSGRPDRVIEAKKLKTNLNKLEAKIELLTDRIADLPKSIDPGDLFKKLSLLQVEQKAISAEIIAKLSEHEGERSFVNMKDLTAFTEGLKHKLEAAEKSPEIQAELIRKLVSKIVVRPEGYEIAFFAGKLHFASASSQMVSNPLYLQAGQTEKRHATGPAVGKDGIPLSLNLDKKPVGSTLFLNGGR